jgi:hypothetical protein
VAEANCQTTDPSVPCVRISDLITARIFATASLSAAPECVDAGIRAGSVDFHAFLLIFWKSWASILFPDPRILRPDDAPTRRGDNLLSAQCASMILTAPPKPLPLVNQYPATFFRDNVIQNPNEMLARGVFNIDVPHVRLSPAGDNSGEIVHHSRGTGDICRRAMYL